MNREFKFRAWDAKQKYMAYQGTPDLENLQAFVHHFGDSILMESTNVFDKNNKEIYEDDIVIWEGSTSAGYFRHKCQVIFDILEWNGWVVRAYGYTNLGTVPIGMHGVNPIELEIIGNIKETPELM